MQLPKWFLYRSACYLTGKGLTYGPSILPKAAVANGKYSLTINPDNRQRPDICDTNLDALSEGVFDHIFIGQALEGEHDPVLALRKFVAKLKVGGHLVIGLATMQHQEEWVKNRFTGEEIEGWVGQAGASFVGKERIERDGYVLHIYKKLKGYKPLRWLPRSTAKRACIIRYGAIGDMIMLTPLIRTLHEDGYEVTVNATPYALPVLDNNPYVSNILLQEREAIPNPELGEYWKEWEKDYDRYINLSESIEGKLLKVEGRKDFFSPLEWRHENCNKNYYDFTMELGGYPDVKGLNGELYFTPTEDTWAKNFVAKYKDKFVIVWALNGSSHHKNFAMFEPTVREFLDTHPDAIVVTLGDVVAQLLEFPHPQLVPLAGNITLRQAFALTKYAHLVVGPETALLNASACFATPKIVMLSHSSQENLCKYWKNCIPLMPNVDLTPCYGKSGCHQLHYSKESCPSAKLYDENKREVLAEGPLCSTGVIPAFAMLATLSIAKSRFFNGKEAPAGV